MTADVMSRGTARTDATRTETVHVHGLSVRAPSVVAAGRPTAQGPADLTVTTGEPRSVPRTVPPGEVVALVESAAGLEHAIVRREGGYLLRIGGAAEFEIDADLRRATTHCDPAFPSGILDVLVAGYLMASVLQLRGHLVLHASAVEVGGAVYALVGPSGRGKSTLATLLCQAGALLVTDDVLRVDPATPVDGSAGAPPPAAGHAPARPLGPSIDLTDRAVSADRRPTDGTRFLARLGATSTRLRPKAAELAGDEAAATADGRTAAALALATTDHLPLAGVLLPHPDREADAVRAEPVTGTAAMLALLSAPRILGWREPTSLAQQLRQLGDLASAVPVHRVRVPWGPPFAPDLGARVLAELGVLSEP